MMMIIEIINIRKKRKSVQDRTNKFLNKEERERDLVQPTKDI